MGPLLLGSRTSCDILPFLKRNTSVAPCILVMVPRDVHTDGRAKQRSCELTAYGPRQGTPRSAVNGDKA